MIISSFPPSVVCLNCGSDMVEEEVAPNHAWHCITCQQTVRVRKKRFWEFFKRFPRSTLSPRRI